MSSKFNVYKDIAGYWRWSLAASNGEKVAASEAYVTKDGAKRSAQRVKEIAWEATIVVTE